MPRANRHFSPGYIWHITHRCHKKEFLLKFSRDRARWIRWLFEAKKRFDLSILNYTVTSNHIHLLVLDKGNEAIRKSLQLIAGRTGQEYNQRKSRKGAYWEDRYHATAIESGSHFFQCMAYIDLNMVRAGVVEHPSDWLESGFHEIRTPPQRYTLIDRDALKRLYEVKDEESLHRVCEQHTEEMLRKKPSRIPDFTECIAVGSKQYVEQFQEKMAIQGVHRKVVDKNGYFALREEQASYNDVFEGKKGLLSANNTYSWNDFV